MKALEIKNNIVRLVITLLAIVAISVFFNIKHFRIDLTTDKRYTLSDATHVIVNRIKDEPIYVKVYLEGDLPLKFKKLQSSIRDLLTEYQNINPSYFKFEFINPLASSDKEVQKELMEYLYKAGLQPVNIMDKDKEGGRTEKMVFPGAVISYNDIDIGINLLQNNSSLTAEENLNNSLQGMEYQFTNMIRNITEKEIMKIAFIEGHGELSEIYTQDATQALSGFYQVDRGQINGIPGILDAYAAIIIAQPTEKFSEADKFVIDQYIMQGGKVAWFLDATTATLDSLMGGQTVALNRDLNLTDLLFQYGARVNYNLLKDIECSYIPINNAMAGAKQPAFIPVPWHYYPMLMPSNAHPVTKNIDRVMSKFCSSVDFVGEKTSNKNSVLLYTSNLTSVTTAPAMIALADAKKQPERKEYSHRNLPVAVMLEGDFTTAFSDRNIGKYTQGQKVEFKGSVKYSKMLVVADGDILKNEVAANRGRPSIVPLGFDRFSQHTFGNKDFVLNAINYLTDDEGILSLRGREFKIRLLDKTKIEDQRTMIQVINMVVPLVVLLIGGVVFVISRNRKYGR